MGEVGMEKPGEKAEAGDVGTVKVGLGTETGTDLVARDDTGVRDGSVNGPHTELAPTGASDSRNGFRSGSIAKSTWLSCS